MHVVKENLEPAAVETAAHGVGQSDQRLSRLSKHPVPTPGGINQLTSISGLIKLASGSGGENYYELVR